MELLADLFTIVIKNILALIFLIVTVTLIYMYLRDRNQFDHTIRRNYPIVGRFRYIFEEIGVFFRQYFFALDREEMPFHRATRSWVYRAAKRENTLQAFGSTREQSEGDVVFANAAIPWMDESGSDSITFGPYCPNPYKTDKVFHISGMSFGAISKPAVEALATGAKKAGIWINSGEGGASPAHLESGADVVIQIGTAKYGVRDPEGNLSEEKLIALAERPNVRMFEIKLSQGAKPGKGGILPAEKVSEEIALQRGIVAGEASISPAGHTDIRCYDDLFEMIHRVRSITEKPTGFKICIGNMDDFDAMITSLVTRAEAASAATDDPDAKERAYQKTIEDYAPDFITVDSGNGGTGAAPMSLIDAAGMNIQESLPLVINLLNRLNIKDRIRVVASGKLITPIEVGWALCVGADAVTNARGFMFSLGCIQALQCHQNTCPTGITTHNPKLQNGLDPMTKSERVAAYAEEIHKELDIIAHSVGVPNPHHLNRNHAMIYVSNQRAVLMADIYKGDLSHPTNLIKQ